MATSAGGIIENLERLRAVTPLNDHDWLTYLNLSWKDYALVRSGVQYLPTKTLKILADKLGDKFESFSAGSLDFHELEIQQDLKRWQMPDRYNFGMHGRCRTTITSFDFLEKRFGWRLRFDTLKHFSMSEIVLADAFAPISMKFITDVCQFLSVERNLADADFFDMGLHSYIGNKDSILGNTLRTLPDVKAVLEHMWGDLLPLLEQNCHYKFLQLNATRAAIEVISNKHVADELNVRHLGSKHICRLKKGMMAAAPAYIGLPMAEVTETSCVHDGDDSCLFEMEYSS